MLGHACGQEEIPSTRPYLSNRKHTQSDDPKMWNFNMKSAQDTHTQTLFFSLSLCIVAAAWPKTVKPKLDHPEAQSVYEVNISQSELASKVCGLREINFGADGRIRDYRHQTPTLCRPMLCCMVLSNGRACS